jgi:DNA-binding transcriptional regulator YhcF (GntR family)
MHLDKQHSVPIYIQLKQLLRRQIEHGVYLPHQKLPSERDLSQRYNLSRMTARRALQELISEGLAYTQLGKGTFVANKPNDITSISANKADQLAIFRIPYIAGPPIVNPNMFFGRQSDLGKVISLLTGNFVMLIGPRRIGKTSLLYQLSHYLLKLENTSKNLIPVLISIEGVPENEFFHSIMEEVLNAVQEQILFQISDNLSFDLSNPIYSSRDFSRDLQIILKNLQNTTPIPSELVLLMDEMDTINSYSLETQSQLRRIFQRFTNRNLSIIVAGVSLHQHWAGESSPFYNMFIPVKLAPFSDLEARRLITEPVEDFYSYNDEAIAYILEATSRLPNRIQQLCLEIIHYLSTNSKSRTNITVEDVDNVLQSIHWSDEEIIHQDEATALYITGQLAVITEEKIPYETTKPKSEDIEINQ